jgi:hypothetical protein
MNSERSGKHNKGARNSNALAAVLDFHTIVLFVHLFLFFFSP